MMVLMLKMLASVALAFGPPPPPASKNMVMTC